MRLQAGWGPDIGQAERFGQYRLASRATNIIVENSSAGERMRATLPDDFPRGRLIEHLAERLARHPGIERVWLLGSRARRDNFERSDIDPAIEAPTMDHYDWLRIKLTFEDEVPTLLLIDLVR